MGRPRTRAVSETASLEEQEALETEKQRQRSQVAKKRWETRKLRGNVEPAGEVFKAKFSIYEFNIASEILAHKRTIYPDGYYPLSRYCNDCVRGAVAWLARLDDEEIVAKLRFWRTWLRRCTPRAPGRNLKVVQFTVKPETAQAKGYLISRADSHISYNLLSRMGNLMMHRQYFEAGVLKNRAPRLPDDPVDLEDLARRGVAV